MQDVNSVKAKILYSGIVAKGEKKGSYLVRILAPHKQKPPLPSTIRQKKFLIDWTAQAYFESEYGSLAEQQRVRFSISNTERDLRGVRYIDHLEPEIVYAVDDFEGFGQLHEHASRMGGVRFMMVRRRPDPHSTYLYYRIPSAVLRKFLVQLGCAGELCNGMALLFTAGRRADWNNAIAVETIIAIECRAKGEAAPTVSSIWP